MITQYSYLKNTPLSIKILLFIAAVLSMLPLFNLLYHVIVNLPITNGETLSLADIGQMGDFFGGHTAAFAGGATLIAFLFFSYHQSRQQEQFFIEQNKIDRESASHELKAQEKIEKEKLQFQERFATRDLFMKGLDLISQWDLREAGCDQAMRLLDYHARLALKSEDTELLLILNTVITDEIRKNLNGTNGAGKVENYPFAVKALGRIGDLRKRDVMTLKGLINETP